MNAGRWPRPAASLLATFLLGGCPGTTDDAPTDADAVSHDATHHPADDPLDTPTDVAHEDTSDLPPVPAAREVTLIGLDRWEVIPDTEDPWREERPPDLDCDLNLPRVEWELLEFDTGACRHFSVRRPLETDIRPGDAIDLVASHTVLISEEAGEGHMEIRIGGHAVFRYETAIPGAQRVIQENEIATFDAQPGDWVEVHVRNHGANSWRLHQLRRQR